MAGALLLVCMGSSLMSVKLPKVVEGMVPMHGGCGAPQPGFLLGTHAKRMLQEMAFTDGFDGGGPFNLCV